MARGSRRSGRGARGSTRRALLGLLSLLGVLQFQSAAWGGTIVLEASADATLIEDAAGASANGAGPALFVGRNSGFVARRALLAFDVASALPPGAWITGVELELEMTPSNRVPIDVALHRVVRPWSEGPSSASGGGGAPAEPGDVTWVHTSYDVERWHRPGGDFDARPSATIPVAEPGLYVWGSTPELVADVWSWLDDPSQSFGWILIGGEDQRRTAKSFGSRESPFPVERPRLIIRYETRCDDFDLGRGALGLCRAHCEALDCAGPDPGGSARACAQLARAFERRTSAPPPCSRPLLD